MKKLFVLLSFMASTFLVLGEGTKELRPTQNDQGSLHIGMMNNNYTSFGTYGVAPEEQIRIRIASTDETIYFGMGGIGNGGGGRPFRVVSPSGDIVYQSTIPDFGEGSIGSWQDAVDGPREIDGVGYDAIAIQPEEVGDYIIEYSPIGGDFTISLFDVTVADANNQPILGRLHSLGWQLDTGSYNNPFSGTVFPYDPNGIVYEVDFNGMQPYLFVINFNSKGTANTGDFVADRMSRIGNYTFPEFEVFLNPPDSVLYPTYERNVTFNGEIVNMDCRSTEYCLNFTSNVEGYLDGYIDINADDIYTDGIDIYFTHHFLDSGTTCIPWDGTDANGNIADRDDIQIIASFGFGVTHLPIFDAEYNRGGYIVNIAAPAGLDRPAIYWDDSEITQGTADDGKVNLIGCTPSGSFGCHRWRERGDRRGNNDPGLPTSPETINTWWYAKVLYDTLLLSSLENPGVQLSFEPDGLRQADTVVCEGSPVPVYINMDSINHYDATRFRYDWYIDSDPVGQDVREINRIITGYTEVVIQATDRSSDECVSYDTLRIEAVPPVTIQADVVHPDCDQPFGSVTVTILTSPPNPEYSWLEFPDTTGNRISNLSPGTYSLHIEDPDFPEACALDASFTVDGIVGIAIEDIQMDSSLCYRNTGTASVAMQDPSRQYMYSWDGQAEGSSSSVNSLSPGSHTIAVRDISTGCIVDSVFEIGQLPISISVSSADVVCGEPTGSISVTVPDPAYFDIYWDTVLDNVLVRNSLDTGTYTVEAVATSNPTCRDDSVVQITGTLPIAIDQINTTPSLCYEHTGEADVTMQDPDGQYEYTWDGQPASSASSVNGLARGNHTIFVRETVTGCTDDSVFVIEELPFEILAVAEDIECGEPTGSIQLTIPDGNFTTSWNGMVENVQSKTGLDTGSYNIEVVANLNNSCRADTTVEIGGSEAISIDEITTEPSLCYQHTGEAAVTMQDPARLYEYSWDYQPYMSNSSVSGLAPGNHFIHVRDAATGCMDDSTFVIEELPFTIAAEDEDIACTTTAGRIQLAIPTGNFNILWNGIQDNVLVKDNLSAGTYTIEVIAVISSTCRADTALEITGMGGIAIDSITTAPSLCYENTGEAAAFMEDPDRTYSYSWDSQAETALSSVSGLAPGSHTLLVTDDMGCTDDTTFFIEQLPLHFSLTKEDITCSQETGTVQLQLPQGDFTIQWDGVTDNVTAKDSLGEGSHTVSVFATSNASCRMDTNYTIDNYFYTIDADFTYVSLAYKQKMETEADIQFTNTSPGNIATSDWDFGDGGTSDEFDPIYTYYTPGQYIITLNVTDENGCPGSVQKVLDITQHTPCGIEFPNAFTPNDDGHNDDIGILGWAESVELKIFNRWGEVIFRTKEIPKRWDGTYRNQQSPVSAYPFILDWECPDETGRLRKYQRVGDVSLIR